jgi:hypothetical protein
METIGLDKQTRYMFAYPETLICCMMSFQLLTNELKEGSTT